MQEKPKSIIVSMFEGLAILIVLLGKSLIILVLSLVKAISIDFYHNILDNKKKFFKKEVHHDSANKKHPDYVEIKHKEPTETETSDQFVRLP